MTKRADAEDDQNSQEARHSSSLVTSLRREDRDATKSLKLEDEATEDGE